MISIVSGKLGGGKSLYCTYMMAQHLASGGIVCTNIKLNLQGIRAYTGRLVQPRQIIPLSENDKPEKIPRGDFRGSGSRRVLIVLDEALNWFDNSKSKDDRLGDWQIWLRQSDKLGQDVFFISQNFEKFVKSGRDLAQKRYWCFDLGKLRFPFLGIGLPFFKRLVCVLVRDVSSGMLIKRIWITKSQALFNCYNTAELFGALKASENAYSGFDMPPKSKLVVYLKYCIIFQLFLSFVLFLYAKSTGAL